MSATEHILNAIMLTIFLGIFSIRSSVYRRLCKRLSHRVAFVVALLGLLIIRLRFLYSSFILFERVSIRRDSMVQLSCLQPNQTQQMEQKHRAALCRLFNYLRA